MPKNQELILVRGPSGSGKTTFSKKTYPEYEHYEADMWFMRDGEYKFDRNMLHKAHGWCQHSTRRSLENGDSVIVSNTFTRMKEMKAYLKMAKELEIPVKVYRTTRQFQNTHGVPDEVVENMRARMQDYEGEILIK